MLGLGKKQDDTAVDLSYPENETDTQAAATLIQPTPVQSEPVAPAQQTAPLEESATKTGSPVEPISPEAQAKGAELSALAGGVTPKPAGAELEALATAAQTVTPASKELAAPAQEVGYVDEQTLQAQAAPVIPPVETKQEQKGAELQALAQSVPSIAEPQPRPATVSVESAAVDPVAPVSTPTTPIVENAPVTSLPTAESVVPESVVNEPVPVIASEAESITTSAPTGDLAALEARVAKLEEQVSKWV